MKKMINKWAVPVSMLLSLTLVWSPSYGAKKSLKGQVLVDGSSTVFPITEAVAEEFRSEFPRIRVAIGVSGTGGGFKKYLKGETDMNNASRKIKDKEVKLAAKNKVKFQEIAVAYDGITVVVSRKNKWVDYLTVSELNKIWKPGSKVKTWKDVRSTWPAKPIRLYGPGTDSGTFDYFTEAINGKSHVSRSDYTKSEDDNVLVQGVADDELALAYFGFSYYQENKSRLKVVPVSLTSGKKPVAPTLTTINNGSYKPLARPVFIYVNPKSVKEKPSVYEFTKFYLKNAKKLVKEVGYVPLPDAQYKAQLTQLETLKK